MRRGPTYQGGGEQARRGRGVVVAGGVATTTDHRRKATTVPRPNERPISLRWTFWGTEGMRCGK